MTKQMLDADTLLKRATPITGQEAVEISRSAISFACRSRCRNTCARRASRI